MRKKDTAKIILLPLIVALITTLSILFVEGNTEDNQLYEILTLFAMLFLAIYFFTIIFVLPLYFFITKKFKNILFSLFLLNIVGLIIICCIDVWFITIFDSKSLYMIYPLFSILTI